VVHGWQTLEVNHEKNEKGNDDWKEKDEKNDKKTRTTRNASKVWAKITRD
jgi:hypothetical protein